jgi:hypothetical protein
MPFKLKQLSGFHLEQIIEAQEKLDKFIYINNIQLINSNAVKDAPNDTHLLRPHFMLNS